MRRNADLRGCGPSSEKTCLGSSSISLKRKRGEGKLTSQASRWEPMPTAIPRKRLPPTGRDFLSSRHEEAVIDPDSDSTSDLPGSTPPPPPRKSKLSTRDKPAEDAELLKPRHSSPKSPHLDAKKLSLPEDTSDDEEEDLPEDNEKEEASKWQAPPVKKLTYSKEKVEEVTSSSNSSASAPAAGALIEH
ncbi:hypothetical protein R1flu_026879 [Riccia fluitans]|uniref:Uncharacterized protein n=1 Tax=Riccia fluitans TaxID=41844 RepID=A0ABD1XK87_9MARC